MKKVAAVTLASLAVHAAVFTWAGHARRHVTPSPPTMTGEHFAAPEMEDLPPDPPPVSPSPLSPLSPSPVSLSPSPLSPSPVSLSPLASGPSPLAPRLSPSSSSPDHATTTSSAIDAPSPSLFGAVGDRSAIDLATAFTRAFPQAASTDPAWITAPFGSAGSTQITLTLDDTGHITGVTTDGGTPPLRAGVTRTLALIRGRLFVARADVTRLQLDATVSADEVHDGLHGDVFAVGASMQPSEGNAFFALAIGRRVDLRIRLR